MRDVQKMKLPAALGVGLVLVLLPCHLHGQQDEIVFVCNRDGVDNICLTPAAEHSEIRQLTSGQDAREPRGGPRWSLDHRQIAFHQRTNGRTDVYSMNSDGSGVRKLTNSDGAAMFRNPAWSPDGSRLAIECGGGTAWDICIIATDGSNLRKLTDASVGGGSSESPDWSPEGNRIAFHSNRNAIASGTSPFRGSDIYVMDSDGSRVRRLTVTQAGRTSQNPAWRRDGQLIAFASTRDGDSLIMDWAIYEIQPDGTKMQRLTHDSARFGYGHPRWSPSGRQFVFHSNRDGVQGSASEVELYLIDADGGNRRRLTGNKFYDGFADW